MAKHFSSDEDSWENDPVWKLVEDVPTVTASAHFADRVVRAARLDEAAASWWSRFSSPWLWIVPASTAAVAALGIMLFMEPAQNISTRNLDAQRAEIEAIADREVLLTVVDNLDDFSDRDLMSLAGF